MAKLCLQHAVLLAVTLLSTIVSFVTAQGFPDLRILCLGDSITRGSGSLDLNGYRKGLREKIVAYGNASNSLVDMVGSLKGGNMQDNDHQGHSGKMIREINTYWNLSIAARPNIVLIHAGTNNMDMGVDLDQAPMLMKNMILGIMSAAPEAVVFVAPVIWANDTRMQANTDKFNVDLRAIIAELQQAGKLLLEVPIDIGISDLADKKHPNDLGYAKMADAWYNAILQAHNRTWLQQPIKLGPQDVSSVGLSITTGRQVGSQSVEAGCNGGNWESMGTVFDDYRDWEDVGGIMGPVANAYQAGLILTDLNNDGLADYIMVDNNGAVRAWINNNGSAMQWTSLGQINPTWSGVTRSMIRMADVDNDGRADMIVIYSTGVAKIWKNTNDGKNFTLINSQWATGLKDRDKTFFEDMDGDGYADRVIVYSTGAIKWARNTGNNGNDTSKPNWETEKTIASSFPNAASAKVQLRDLDGDKKSDVVVVYPGGSVRGFRNSGILKSDTYGGNWIDLGIISPSSTGVTAPMARLADMDGDGLADFLGVATDGSIKMWRKRHAVASGDTKGAVFRFADLTGNGRADLIVVDPKGRSRVWLNQGGRKWNSLGEMTPSIPGGISATARAEFSDVNGDGLADYLVIEQSGSVKAYLNNGNIPDAGKGLFWQSALTIASGTSQPGDKTRFTDVTGNGYADYLILLQNGNFYTYLNQKNIPAQNGGRVWGTQGTVKPSGVQAPNKVFFADITGSGRAQYLIHDTYGNVTAYNNPGLNPSTGKMGAWSRMGVIATNLTSQGTGIYADIDGDGKDDYLVVSSTGQVDAYRNICNWNSTA
ncbi:chitinase [Fusarium albosuccineum]|uniref:Chitinase n=1 Tax=Fusarium albosuccineum TaxID=1237068 RepID=A0A8H4PBL1_9HYPO|nr:chitinase [Fusarium albosuccineum]